MIGVSRWPRWLLLVLALLVSGVAEAKTPGKTYCFLGVCHRVMTLAETQRAVGRSETLHASHYDDAKYDRFNPSNLTSSGAYFRAGQADNAASPIYPDGTVLLVWYPETRKAVVVRVDNAGPYYKNRKLDLSRGAAMKLGFGKRGVARVVVRVIKAPTAVEARYRRGRVYAPVAGYIGTFASLEHATGSAGFGMGPPGVAGGQLVAGAGKPDDAVGVPRRKPMLLAAIARAERRAVRQVRRRQVMRRSVQQFKLIGEYPTQPVRGGERTLVRPMVLANLTGAGAGVSLSSAAGVTRKREVAQKRIIQVMNGAPRLEPMQVSRRGGMAAVPIDAGVSTQTGVGVKSVAVESTATPASSVASE